MTTMALSSAAATSNVSPENESSSSSEEEEEEPSLSSAALCISMSILGLQFRPEFTHQYFHGEYIPGYMPTPQALVEAEEQNNSSMLDNKQFNNKVSFLHSSHRHHEKATHTLDASVILAPSCRTCKLSFNVVEKSNKRPRIQERSWSDNNEPTNEDNDTKNNNPNYQHNNHPMERLSTDEIQDRLRKALPADIQSEDDVKLDYLDQVVGTELTTYTRKIRFSDRPSSSKRMKEEIQEEEATFVVSVANGVDASKYHKEVQKIALCFIENADNVDLASSEGGGYWKVIYLFRRHTAVGKANTKYSLVGYMTLFHFFSPFKKPKGGVVIRICQALVLPPYQRAGHGKVMFNAVHDIANQKYKVEDKSLVPAAHNEDDIVEINVEDPAPSFMALRDKVDYESLLRACKENTRAPWGLEHKYISSTLNAENAKSFFVPLPEADAVAAGAVAKITSRQVTTTYELYKLRALQDALENEQESNPTSPLSNREIFEKEYRLMVKRRLLKTHREDLGGLTTKEDKQAYLAKAFDQVQSHYLAVIGFKRSLR